MISEFNFNDFLFGLFFKIYYFWVRFVNYWREDRTLILTQKKCSAKSEIFAFPETSDEFSRSHVI